METLEDRNLNRLKRGKMMLEFSEVRKSPILTFILAFFLGFAGAQRFYLGQPKVALSIIAGGIISYSFLLGLTDLAYSAIPVLFWHGFLLVELVLAPYTSARVNRATKQQLKSKYGVVDV